MKQTATRRGEQITEVNFIPPNMNVTDSFLRRGDKLEVYGTVVSIFNLRRYTRPSTIGNPSFSYYMVSFDPQNHGWYHVTKETEANIQRVYN